jgi:hypothetical protein
LPRIQVRPKNIVQFEVTGSSHVDRDLAAIAEKEVEDIYDKN